MRTKKTKVEICLKSNTRTDFVFFCRRGGKILGGVQVICNMPFLMLWKGQEMATKVHQGGEAKF